MENHLSELKISKYNQRIEMEGKLFIYNALTGGYARISEQYKRNFSNIKDVNLDVEKELGNLPEDIVETLISGGFLIPKYMDELKVIESMHKRIRYGGRNSLGLTILPTLNCNFRCPYCYEKDKQYPNSIITSEVINAIVKYVEDSLQEGGSLNMCWYGGEPLMAFKELKVLQNKILELVEQKRLKLQCMIVTNGYLLTPEVADELVRMKIKNVQITLDGVGEIHDKTRYLVNGKGTFDQIINNLRMINENLQVAVRVNLQRENIKYVPEFLDYLNMIGFSNKKNIRPYFSIVRDYAVEKGFIQSNCYSIPEFSKEELLLREITREKGFYVDDEITPRAYSSCGAVTPNSIIVEPDGTLQKCWNVVGNKDEAVGNILNQKETAIKKMLYLSNESKWYSWKEYESKECQECDVLPLCMGGCPFYTANSNKLFEEYKYKCISARYNLQETLQEFAHRYINENLYKDTCKGGMENGMG